jgi:hypothetical protein
MEPTERIRKWNPIANEPLSVLEPGFVSAQDWSIDVVLQSWTESKQMVGHDDGIA